MGSKGSLEVCAEHLCVMAEKGRAHLISLVRPYGAARAAAGSPGEGCGTKIGEGMGAATSCMNAVQRSSLRARTCKFVLSPLRSPQSV